ncbi:hypothetical protein CCACVL1_18281 [Corchorus capsularis]|uniref:Uncharacterized protein n=1 Tax=Corchorus capsularis TaxID=210143 RepID=A0A1R3HM37_COCAP|nr:hypothetical protein CCACVL1_18281 [Corchorus capsularis]
MEYVKDERKWKLGMNIDARGQKRALYRPSPIKSPRRANIAKSSRTQST